MEEMRISYMKKDNFANESFYNVLYITGYESKKNIMCNCIHPWHEEIGY